MIHTSPNGFESELIRSAITSSVVTTTVTAANTTAATTTAAAATTTATGSITATDSTTLTTASPTEIRLKNRLQRIIRIPPSVAQTHSNKATASTSTHTPPSSATSPNTTTTSPTINTTTPKHRGGHSRVEKKQLVGATIAIGQDKPLVTTTTVTFRLVGSGTDLSAPPSTPSPAPAAPTPVSDSYPDSYLSEKNPETIKVVDQHHLHNPYYYSPDPMPQRQVYTVGSSLLAKAKVKARALQHNLLSPQQQQQHQQHSIQQQHQQKQHELDPLTKLELHKGNQEEGADGRGSSSDGTDVESNASNSNSNTISVGTSNHLKSIHYQHHHLHHRSSSAQLDNTIMGDIDPQSDNSHDHSNDSDSTVTDHPPHEALLSPPTPRSRKCSLRSRNSIGPDEEKLSTACIAVAGGGGGATALLTTTPAVLPRSLSKETAAGVEELDDEDNAVVFAEEKKADMIGEALLLSDSPEPTMLMTTQDSAALYEAIFQRQHPTEEAIAESLHELRQLILAYGIPEQL
ncbi:hypothetical protein KI688_011427 [Linnemannia hyalina]|uniref:Uncharacterized protein n=1 Tax=Linnemannia hyalina TaxID=64524 RepID=A0A9P8BT42_9FUNG|nr:hypothetical protein KI688_011427 [Linnemannia hyalina]